MPKCSKMRHQDRLHSGRVGVLEGMRMNTKRNGLTRVALEAAPLALAVLAGGMWLLGQPHLLADSEQVWLDTVEAASAEDLEILFSAEDYGWPPAGPVPAIELSRLPPDLARRHPWQRKELFLRTLLPLILAENRQALQQREFLLRAFAAGPLDPADPRLRRIRVIARYYRLDGDVNEAAFRQELLARADEIPAALALAQAASESGWGTSRLALEANNLFGQYTPAPGQPPQQVPAAFPDLRSAVRSYLRNLNSNPAYAELRRAREKLRRADRPLDAVRLAEGLRRYSSRGRAYIGEVQHLIRSNGLHTLQPAALAR